MRPSFQHIEVIINPAAGADEAILNTLNRVFGAQDLTWDARITHAAGDATRLARAAIAAGADLVAAYGGDGTLMEVANGLLDSDVPLAILPGGTGNAIAVDLGIPLGLEAAARLIGAKRPTLRALDVGRAIATGRDDAEHFLLRVSIGLQAEVADKASRELKDRFGALAYLLAGADLMRQPTRATFHLEVDGKAIECQGITALVANSGSLGRFKMNLAAQTAPDDGLLDVFVLNDDLNSALSVAASLLEWEEGAAALQHWQGKHITVTTDPPLALRLDGEGDGQTPLTAEVVAGALRVVVPPPADGSAHPD